MRPRPGSDVWMCVMELKHHLLAGREASLHPTITRSPTVFLRRSQTVEAFYTLRTRPGSVWRRFLLPLGSPLSCRPTLPTVLISDWGFFLENLILIFFSSLLVANKPLKSRIRFLAAVSASTETQEATCAVHVTRRAPPCPMLRKRVKSHLLRKYHVDISS